MRTVLLLEDDKDLRALLKTAIVAYGLEVLEAGKGTDAEATLLDRTVDLVVVDGLLPDMTGVTFIERVRSRDPRIQIVFVTALFRDRKTYKQLTEQLDVPQVLYKPLDPVAFAAKIADLLEQTARAQHPERRRSPRRPPKPLELTEWRRQYGENLPRKLLALEQAIRANKLAAAQMMAHGLRGSSGSFGFAEVGDVVGTIEDLVIQAIENRTTGQLFWQRLDDALRKAHKAAGVGPAPGSAGREHQVIISPSAVGTRPRAQNPWVSGGVDLKVLLVDDEEDILKIARLSLESMGKLTVVTAQSAREGLALAAKEAPHLILMDVLMPGMDGPSALLEMQRDPQLRAIPVIFMTARVRQSDVDQFLEAGAVGVIQKPFDPMTLPDEIWRIMRARSSVD